MTCEQEVIHYRNMIKLYKFDHITGMKQRHDFEVETAHKMTNQVFYLAMIDITGLHAINRNEGYAAGDALIRKVASDIQHSEALWECYRIGGDEFMALYFDIPTTEIENTTMCVEYSGNFENLNDLVKAVDIKVTAAKQRLNRRREDQ